MRRIMGGLVVCLTMGINACASIQEARSVEKSGFLGDYSMLKEGTRNTTGFGSDVENQALLVYKNPATDWKKTRKFGSIL